MNIKLSLFAEEITKSILQKLDYLDIDFSESVNTTAIDILSEIQQIIQNDKLTDFEIVEEIVCLFEKHNIDCGGCHDF